jgi:C1A family cysteine protease
MQAHHVLLFALTISNPLLAQDATILKTITQQVRPTNHRLDLFTSQQRVDIENTFKEMKQALKQQDEVTFGARLLDFDLGLTDAVGSYNSQFDTWVLTPKMVHNVYLRTAVGGHQLVITGYDDDAVALDNEGHQHQGLLTVHDSNGSAGNNQTRYMSYDYFKVLMIEAQRVAAMPADGGLDSITT